LLEIFIGDSSFSGARLRRYIPRGGFFAGEAEMSQGYEAD